MADKNQFYDVNHWEDSFKVGVVLKIVHSLNFREWDAGPHLAPLVELSAAELGKKLKESKEQEKPIFEKVKAAVAEWDEQAAQTLLLEKALEYVRTPEVEHTSNEWKQLKDGTWEISNHVYKMQYRFDPVPQSEAVRVSWGIKYNVPRQPGNQRFVSWGDSINITGQDKKLYDNVGAAQRYIQGRFDLYAHLFSELSPPVPNDCKRFFSVNGCLCAGYTLAPPERTSAKDIDALLDCLEDEDIFSAGQTAAPAPAISKPARPASMKKPNRKKSELLR